MLLMWAARYVYELEPILGHKGLITYREYADWYYGDFYNYTNTVLGKNNGLIMSRPVDALGDILYWNFSPRYVVWSGMSNMHFNI